MGPMTRLLHLAARYRRFVLIAGLVAGIAFPALASAMKPWLGEMVTVMLFVAALRIGPRAAAGTWRDLRKAVILTMVFQLAAPLALVVLFLAIGFHGAMAAAIIVMASACSIIGSPSLTLLTGNDPAPALRLLIVGTALLPLTVLPVFWLSPEFGSVGAVLMTAARLLGAIALASGLAFAIRHFWLREPSRDMLYAIDGLSAVIMAVVVIGLMSAVGPALMSRPAEVLVMLAITFAFNLGPQVATWFALPASTPPGERVSWSVVAGNRNMGLFLVALPQSVTDPILLYIGCYQVPMFLTPLLLGWLYRPRAG